MPVLSILIPARNEMFLARTVQDILEHREADTEVIVVLDGPSPHEAVPQHERVRVIELKESIGQRAATNLACRLSNAKYVMKLDAHCSLSQGFDRIMLEDIQDNWTMVPAMRNLHAFDWVCSACGHRLYQGPTPDACERCGGQMRREMIWLGKPNPVSTAMRFDKELKFAYWAEYKARQKGNLVETMSILGACWMLTRERYWALNICDEEHGSWGQQGTEVACKTWLSGGRVVCNKRAWFAHLFRTQGGDFGWPYPISGSQINHAREYSQRLFIQGAWEGAVHPLSWLIDRFAPVPEWTPAPEDQTKGIVYYTDSQLDETIAQAVRNQIVAVCPDYEIVSASLKPLTFGRNVVVKGERGNLTMFRQILAALEASTADIIFFCEHDCLYPKEHFDFTPLRHDRFYYDGNAWQVDYQSGKALTHIWRATSGLCAYRNLLLEHYRKRVEMVERDGFSRSMGYEPGTHHRPERVDDYWHEMYEAEVPYIDIRHGGNLTASRWSKDDFRNQRYTKGWTEADEVPGWGVVKGRFKEIIAEIATRGLT